MTTTRSFWVSLVLHGAGIGLACFYGGARAARMHHELHVEVLPSQPAAAIEDPAPPSEQARVERVEEQPELREPCPPAATPVEPACFAPPLEFDPRPLPSTAPSPELLTVVRRRETAAEPPPREPTPRPVAPVPAPLVLEVVPGENPAPDYPWIARRRRWEGVVTIRVFVDSVGTVVQASVARSSRHDVLDAAALAAVRRWRYQGGPGETTQEVEFRLRRE